MATLPSSGNISIMTLRNFFGGDATPTITEYYRGGGRVPSQRYIPSQEIYGQWSAYRFDGPIDHFVYTGVRYTSTTSTSTYFWDGFVQNYSGAPTNVTVGGYNYQRGDFQAQYGNDFWYTVRRRTVTTYPGYYVDINTNVPTSGAIKLTDFYGAVDS